MKPEEVLAGLPKSLRAELFSCYEAICRNYSENRWEPSELNGGKFAEVEPPRISRRLFGLSQAAMTRCSPGSDRRNHMIHVVLRGRTAATI